MNNNVRTMEFISKDNWDRPVYKCIETGYLWKDIELGKNENPVLYSCQNDFDGEPEGIINKNLEIHFINKYVEEPNRFNYMMLDRYRSDCDYYLGYGNRCLSRLYNSSVKDHIEEMKKLYNSFPAAKKPEWLTYEKILEYEKEMEG